MNTFDFSLLMIVSNAFLGNTNKKKNLRYIMAITFALIMSFINMIGNPVINGVSSLILAFLLVVQYGKAKHISLFVTGLFSIVNIFSELIGSNLVMLYYKEFDIVTFPYSDKWLVALTIYKVILLFIIFILTYKKNIEINLLPQHFNILLFTIPLASCVFILSNAKMFSGNSNNLVTANIVAPITILYINLIVLVILRRANIMANELVEKSLLQQEITYKQQYYDALEKNQQQLQELRHNMKNQILAIKAALSSKDITENDDLFGLNKIDPIIFTENPVVNTIISSKYLLAQKEGIDFQTDVNIPSTINMSCGDIGIVLGNLLDNAIDGAEKCPEYIDKKIDITIRRIHQFILIRITNSSAAPPVQRNGQLVTSKKDKQKHGWGIKSVVSTAEKYNGTVEYNYTDFMFSVSVILFY